VHLIATHYNARWGLTLTTWKASETAAKRAIEDCGYTVLDANVLFRENCPNIDLVVFGKLGASYVQVKSSTNPAGKDAVIIDGSPWTEEQLFSGAPIFNRHEGNFLASFVVIVETRPSDETSYYVIRPKDLEELAVPIGRAFMAKPKRDGARRSLFRKEIPRSALAPWLDAWRLFDTSNIGDL
jgi:hypothetical protein